MPEFQVEMRWRCCACQNENLGRFKVCQTCTKPKGPEPFYDADRSSPPNLAQAVTDSRLIALATAGADWECRYCRTRQPRRLKRCDNCGAPEHEEDQARVSAPRLLAGAASDPAEEAAFHAALRRKHRRNWAVAVSVVAVVSGLVFWMLQPRILDARVVAHHWTHSIVVERYQIAAGEGFAENQPANAFDVVNAGQRHHHDDRVQDGTEQQSYSEEVACGEDCSTTSVSCTSNDNGFKSCSGGDRVCSTRYCSETRYRDVPHYKSVPVSATWFRWRAWQWADARQIVDQGSDAPPTWPASDRIALNARCGPGESERVRAEAEYQVEFEDTDQDRHSYVPRDLPEFLALPLGTTKKIRLGPGQSIGLVPLP
ncbi:MAG: hypothetical protein ABIQ16_03680 [Polyangiaceae bacterium]